MNSKKIRELIYFDVPKSLSLWSQIQGGLLEKISTTTEETHDSSKGGIVGIPKFIEVRAGNSEIDKTIIQESKIIHHDLLNKLEEELNTLNLIINLNETISSAESSEEVIRSFLFDKPYLISKGWAVIEDYRKIQLFTENFNQIVEFIVKCAKETIQNTSDYKKLQSDLEDFKTAIKKEKDQNTLSILKSQIKGIQNQLDKSIESSLSPVHSWLINGIKTWISTFMPNRINLRIYPFDNCPSFQIISNLKPNYFVDQDLEHILYGYGNRPNIQLSVFGLITSQPPLGDPLFDPLKEFENIQQPDGKIVFEKAFREVFKAFDEMESFIRYSRYPNVTVHPIAVFRDINIEK
jgi:hypothetical protein